MKPAMRFWLFVPFAMMALFFALERADAQRFPPGTQPGGMKPPGGGIMDETVWNCWKCKREIGRGPFGPTLTCSCGVEYTNGFGVERKNRNNQIAASPPPAVTTPPMGGMTPMGGMMPPASRPTNIDTAAQTASGGLIAGGLTLILFGLAVLGSVVFLVLQNGKDYSGPARRRRSR